MKKLVLITSLALAATSALADSGMKPGLWEMRVIKQIVDGQDMAAQMAEAQKQMQKMLADMPPAQRKQMEQAMGGQAAMPSNNTQRICISPAMAADDKPVVPTEAKCEPSKVQRSGNKTTYELNCPNMKGKGESIVSGDTITSKMDMVVTERGERHTMQSESQMKYLGSDCKGIKPADQMMREMQRGGGR